MKARVISKHQLTADDQEKMFSLLSQHFLGVKNEVFRSDLDEKNWIILIENSKGHLAGFSTIQLYQTNYQGQAISVVYSGDTIMDRSAWSSLCLPRAWIRTIKDISSQHNAERIVWLLITSGFRTYRFLPVFWREYYPRYDKRTPTDINALIQFLAHERFGGQYDASRGIVRFDYPHALITDLAVVPEGKASDPHVAYFNQLNPGHVAGDELVCFTEISDENLSAAGRRMLSGVFLKNKTASCVQLD